jgi:hypothetical protein
MIKKIFLAAIFSGIFIMNIALVNAQDATTIAPTGLIPKASGQVSDGCKAPAGTDPATYCGDYRLEDFVALGIGASNWILGIVGSLSLFMFVYGGIMFLISAGASDKIGQARKIIVASVVGLIIVFSSYLIIKFVVSGIGANQKYQLGAQSTSIK